MFNVTDSALERLSHALGGLETKSDNACFRIVPGDGGKLALILGETTPDDKEYEHAGATVLALSNDIAERCEGRTLDSDKTGNLVLT